MKPHYRWSWELKKPVFVTYWYPGLSQLRDLAHRNIKTVYVGFCR